MEPSHGRTDVIPMRLADAARAAGTTCPAHAASWMVTGISTDSRQIAAGDLFIGLRGPTFDGSDYADQALASGARAVLVSSAFGRRFRRRSSAGVSGDGAAVLTVGDTLGAFGKLSAYYRRAVMDGGTVVIAVTGSNGKTTTKRLIDHVLSPDLPGRTSPGSLNNAVGVPLTLFSARRGDRYLVVEIGTNAPGEVAMLADLASPDIAVITSIGVAHTAGLGSLSAIAAEKASILRYVRSPVAGGAGGFAVINVDQGELLDHVPGDYTCSRWAAGIGPATQSCGEPWTGADKTRAEGGRAGTCGERIHVEDAAARVLVTVGRSRAAEMVITDVEADLSGTRFVLDGVIRVKLRMPGVHHAAGAAAAYVVGRRMGIVADEIIQRMGAFQPLDGRTRVIRAEGLTIIDDCYNANPSSMSAAVELLRGIADRRRVLVLGDMLELDEQSDGWHRRLGEAAARAGVEVLVTVGAHADAAADAARAGGLPQVQHTASASEAAEVVDEVVRDGDVVLVKGSRGVRLEGVVERLRSRRREPVATA